MSDVTIPPSDFDSSRQVEKSQKNQNCEDLSHFDDIVSKNAGLIPGTPSEFALLRFLPQDNVYRLFCRICGYIETGERVLTPDGDDEKTAKENALFETWVARIETDKKRRLDLLEKRRNAGRKGGKISRANAKKTNDPNADESTFQAKSDFASNLLTSNSESSSNECNVKIPPLRACESACAGECGSQDNEGGGGFLSSSRTLESIENSGISCISDAFCISTPEAVSQTTPESSSAADSEKTQTKKWRARDMKEIEAGWTFDVPMERTWEVKNDPTLDEMLSVIRCPSARSLWAPVSMGILDFGLDDKTISIWRAWCRTGGNFNEQGNDQFLKSYKNRKNRKRNGSKGEITRDTLYAIYWHGFGVVRPFLGVSGVCCKKKAKRYVSSDEKNIAEGWKRRGENSAIAPSSGHAICGGRLAAEIANVSVGKSVEPSKEELHEMMIAYMTGRGFTLDTIERMGCEGVWFRTLQRPAIKIPYLGMHGFFAYKFMDIGPNEHDGRDRYWTSKGDARNYGMWVLKHKLYKDICLVEGHLDAATLMQEGFPAIAVKDLSKLIRYVKNNPIEGLRFVIVRDGDEEGERYGTCWAESLKANGINCVVRQLPGGVNDANGYLMAYGSASLRKQMERLMKDDDKPADSITA